MFQGWRWLAMAAAMAACGGVDDTMATTKTALIRGRVTAIGREARPLPDLRPPRGAAPSSAGAITVEDVRLDLRYRGAVVVSNSGPALSYVSLSADDDRVLLSSQEGDVPPGGSLAFEVSVDPSGLAPGLHGRVVRVRCEEGVAFARVEFRVYPPGEALISVVAYTQQRGALSPALETEVSLGAPDFELRLAPGDYLLEAATEEDRAARTAVRADGMTAYRVNEGLREVRVGEGERVEGVELLLPGRR